MRLALLFLFLAGPAFAVPQSAGVHADRIGDAVRLDGGGSYDPASGQISLGGGFKVLNDITAGPLGGLRKYDGTRWKATQILADAPFKCAGADAAKTVVTDDDTVVFLADFFRGGEGAVALFHAKVFLSANDEDPDQPGIQNVWIQGVGCDEGADLRPAAAAVR